MLRFFNGYPYSFTIICPVRDRSGSGGILPSATDDFGDVDPDWGRDNKKQYRGGQR